MTSNKNRSIDAEKNKKLIMNAKNGDEEAKLALLSRYKPLIFKYSLKIHLKGFDFDDLLQHGTLSVLNAIDKYNLNKDAKFLDSYIINTIKNNYANLQRNQSKKSTETSLNTPVENTDNEVIDLIPCDESTEGIAMKNLVAKEILNALNTLTLEEQELLLHVYITRDFTVKGYCHFKNISYYEGRKMNKRVLAKLREALKDLY